MRVILCCGGREWNKFEVVYETLKREHKNSPIDYIIEGGQRTFPNKNYKNDYGADYQSKQAAMKLGIQVIECPANWEYYNKAAGPIRNQKQLELLNILGNIGLLQLDEGIDTEVLVFHSDIKNSKGTKDMGNRAKKAGVKVRVVK